MIMYRSLLHYAARSHVHRKPDLQSKLKYSSATALTLSIGHWVEQASELRPTSQLTMREGSIAFSSVPPLQYSTEHAGFFTQQRTPGPPRAIA